MRDDSGRRRPVVERVSRRRASPLGPALAVLLAVSAGAGLLWFRYLGSPVPEATGISAPATDSVAAPEVAARSLHEAVRRGDRAQIVQARRRGDTRDINAVVGGMTPLMLAASRGEADLVSELLAMGADPNRRGSARRTALQYAAEKNRLDAARLLLAAGADIDGADEANLTPLTMAADRGYTRFALLLLEHGADVNKAHVQGWTPLIDAARRGNAELVRALLAAGADASARLPGGQDALVLAKEGNHGEVIRLLRQARQAP